MSAAAAARSPITTHVLDTSRGHAAADVAITLHRFDAAGSWMTIGAGRTDADGRCATLITPAEHAAAAGSGGADEAVRYKLRFEVGAYFASQQVRTIYPFVEVVFETSPNRAHYHIPLLLNPFGYSTYQGT